MVVSSLVAVALLAPQQSTFEWVDLDGPMLPGIQAAYDSARGRAVLVGWEGETWELEGSTRLHRANLGTARPSRRLRAATAYDPNRGVTLFFGGNGVGFGFPPHLADTWEWNGSAWAPGAGVALPPARVDGVMGYDVGRECFVLYGGQGESGLLYDTWEYDETGWTQIQTNGAPTVSRGRMVYDAARQTLVMISSSGSLGVPMLVHEFDGTSWTVRTPVGAWPLTRSNMSVAYDEGRDVTVMIGGSYHADEIWEWNGTRWSLVHTLPTPWRIDAPAYYDASLGAVVVVGGTTNVPGGGVTTHTDAHAWNGTDFVKLWDDHSPSTRFGQVVFADPITGNLTMAGGSVTTVTNETWEWDGNAWTRLQPANSFPFRSTVASTVDTARNVGLVFGGANGIAFRNDLWAWDGNDWSELVVPNRPAPRAGAAMAFDRDRDVAVVFGGSDGPIFQSGSLRNDTWEWNGTAWTAKPSAVKPPGRESGGMAYDERRGVTVLFGGRTGPTAADQLDDTWEWNGVQWMKVVPSQTPPPLLGPRLIYHPVHERVWMLGANAKGFGSFLLELWEFDGDTWTPIDQDGVAIQGSTSAIWDATRERITLYDGLTVRAWTDTPATAWTYGSGCGRDPLPMVRTRARLGGDQFGFEVRVDPQQVTLFAVGLWFTSIPLRNGCMLLVVPIHFAVEKADGFGTASVVLPIPNNLALRGLAVYAQAAALGSKARGEWGLSAGMGVILGD